jgi:hypothetical protein
MSKFGFKDKGPRQIDIRGFEAFACVCYNYKRIAVNLANVAIVATWLLVCCAIVAVTVTVTVVYYYYLLS